ncbi:MAG: prepilin-type N-terminal cleavage/methylation domain-containing protein [bacterium]|nr:prepilin-type N-terminal cleavage/methylation domain-containing protein [bacterium]
MTRNSKGFTLAELLMSLLVTSVIALAVTSLTISLTKADEYSENFYRHVQIARNSLRRIERDINKAKLITAGSSTSLVYWLEDANDNGDIELTELRLITADVATGKVLLYRAEFPSAWPAAWKTVFDNAMTVPIATNLTIAGIWIKNSLWAHTEELATEVTSFAFTASPSIPTSEVLQTEITVGDGPGLVELRSSASMRANKLAYLYKDSGGTYYLKTP